MASLLDSWKVGTLELKNRIVVSPMCQYMAEESGSPTDWHQVHYGSLALGGAGLLMVEASAVEGRGRISTRDLGLYADEHTEKLARITKFAHEYGTKIGIQLAHAGRKADVPGEIVAPSAQAFSDRYASPRALAGSDLQDIVQAFVRSARRAIQAGFDFLEIHAAHGYLLHQFLSPLSNHRTDEYGGSLVNRMRLTREIIAAVRAEAGATPVGIRISATEYDPGGYDVHEAASFAAEFARDGVDVIDVSSGGNVPVAPAVYPGYQVPLAQVVRAAAGVPVIAVGMLDDAHLAEHVVQSGQADAVAVARGFLRNPHWGHQAIRELGGTPQPPGSYARAYA